MRSFLLLATTLLGTLALLDAKALFTNETLGECGYEATCSASGYDGVCVSISAGCCDGGTVTSGLCPGSSDIKCCTKPTCSTPSGSGTCMGTSQCSSQGGSSVSGYCAGPSDIQCCVQQSSCSTPSGTGSCMQTSQCSSQGGKSIPGYCDGPSDVQCCVKDSCSYEATCTASGYAGVCVSVSSGCCPGGTVSSGLCPGDSDIKCCTQPSCATPAGSGSCIATSQCASEGGVSLGGYCVGPSDIQCCVKGGSGEYGIDISTTISSSSASCFKSSGITYVVPRGYMSIGEVDSSVCPTLINAANAGIPKRDTYLFPCPTCSKSADAQMGEFVSYLNSNCKSAWSGRIWLDIEGSQYWTGSTSANQEWYKVSILFSSFFSIFCLFFFAVIY